jgi:DNA-binding LacI/PurR family transcriptional regulator
VGVTIKDVAKLAGVSPSTVSRVIAGNAKISTATRKKVLEIMEELGYHPNMNARSLVIKNTETLGIIMPRSAESAFLNPFFPEVIRGISVFAQKNGYSILMSTARNASEEKDAVVKMVQGKQVDGVILLQSRVSDTLISYLKEQEFPFVVIGRPKEKNVAYVDNDNRSAAREATAYLIERGHRQIAFLGGSLEYMVTYDRLEGYRQALEEAGIPFMEEYVFQGDFLEEGGYQAVKQMLAREMRPSALLVTDDLMAFGVISALNEMGYAVPDDVSIVSFNNVPLARVSTPPLTTIDIDIYQLGYKGAQLLFDRIQNADLSVSYTMISTKLIERQSVKDVRSENR